MRKKSTNRLFTGGGAKNRKYRKSGRRSRAVRKLTLEHLDQRQLLAVCSLDQSSVEVIDGRLEICGTSGPDRIVVNEEGADHRITVNDSEQLFHSIDKIYIEAGAGKDRIVIHSAVAAEVYAGSGNDFVKSGSGDDILFGQGGADQLRGRGGDDVIDGGWKDDRLYGGSGNDTLYGRGGPDQLVGGGGNDLLLGGGGADILSGGGGHDILRGGAGRDTLSGYNGHDVLVGGGGRDTLSGGRGRDVLLGGKGIDALNGNRGHDVLVGGLSAYDTNTAENNQSLNALSSAWLNAGDNAFEVLDAWLNSGTVSDDDKTDVIHGGNGIDWLYRTSGGVVDTVDVDVEHTTLLQDSSPPTTVHDIPNITVPAGSVMSSIGLGYYFEDDTTSDTDLTYSVSTDNPALIANASVTDGQLTLSYVTGAIATGHIDLQVTDADGAVANRSFAVSISDSLNDPVTIDISLLHDTGIVGDNISYAPALGVLVEGDFSTGPVTLEVDWNGDGIVDNLTSDIDVPGGMAVQPARTLDRVPQDLGPAMAAARITQFNTVGTISTVGTWQEFHYEIIAPPTAQYAINTFDVLTSTGNSTEATLTGTVTGPGNFDALDIDLDLDSDGYPDASTSVAADGTFVYTMDELSLGDQLSIAAVTVEDGPDGLSLASTPKHLMAWINNDGPERGISVPIGTTESTIELDHYFGNGVEQSDFTYVVSTDNSNLIANTQVVDGQLLLSYVAGAEGTAAASVDVTDAGGTTTSTDFLVGVSHLTPSPVDIVLSLTYDTGTPDDMKTYATSLNVAVNGDVGAGRNFIEIDVDGDGFADVRSSDVTDGDSFDLDLSRFGLAFDITPGLKEIYARGVHADPSLSLETFGDWKSFTFDLVAPPPTQFNVVTLEVIADTGSTTEAVLTGSVSGAGSLASVEVLLDIDSDGFADATTVTMSDGTFTYTIDELQEGDALEVDAWITETGPDDLPITSTPLPLAFWMAPTGPRQGTSDNGGTDGSSGASGASGHVCGHPNLVVIGDKCIEVLGVTPVIELHASFATSDEVLDSEVGDDFIEALATQLDIPTSTEDVLAKIQEKLTELIDDAAGSIGNTIGRIARMLLPDSLITSNAMLEMFTLKIKGEVRYNEYTWGQNYNEPSRWFLTSPNVTNEVMLFEKTKSFLPGGLFLTQANDRGMFMDGLRWLVRATATGLTRNPVDAKAVIKSQLGVDYVID